MPAELSSSQRGPEEGGAHLQSRRGPRAPVIRAPNSRSQNNTPSATRTFAPEPGKCPPPPPTAVGRAAHRPQRTGDGQLPPHLRSIWSVGAGQRAPDPPRLAKSPVTPGAGHPPRARPGRPQTQPAPPHTWPTVALKGLSCLGSVCIRGSQRERAKPIGRFQLRAVWGVSTWESGSAPAAREPPMRACCPLCRARPSK